MDRVEPGGDGAIMSFDIREEGGAVLLTLAGELDLSNVQDLERALEPIVAAGPQRLVIDAGELTFADSSAIALWVRWTHTVPAVELREPSPLLRRIIESMGLGELLGVSG